MRRESIVVIIPVYLFLQCCVRVQIPCEMHGMAGFNIVIYYYPKLQTGASDKKSSYQKFKKYSNHLTSENALSEVHLYLIPLASLG